MEKDKAFALPAVPRLKVLLFFSRACMWKFSPELA